jgi:hypothetical protein
MKTYPPPPWRTPVFWLALLGLIAGVAALVVSLTAGANG